MEHQKLSKHFEARTRQRGIRYSTIEMADKYGIQRGDKIFFGKKEINSALKELEIEKSKLLKARDQGGIVSVNKNGTLITVYKIDTFKRNYLNRGEN